MFLLECELVLAILLLVSHPKEAPPYRKSRKGGGPFCVFFAFWAMANRHEIIYIDIYLYIYIQVIYTFLVLSHPFAQVRALQKQSVLQPKEKDMITLIAQLKSSHEQAWKNFAPSGVEPAE